MAGFDEAAIDLPQNYYAPIGEFLFRFAQLEYLMNELIWRCLDIDNKQGRTLTIGAGNQVLRATLGAVSRNSRWVNDTKAQGEIGYIIGRAKEFSDLRNQLVHGSWQHPPGDPLNVAMHYMMESADQRMVPKRKPIPVDTIRHAAGKLKAAVCRAKKLADRIYRDRPPRPARPPL